MWLAIQHELPAGLLRSRRAGTKKSGNHLVIPGKSWDTSRNLNSGRNTQLDGWRAFAVLGVMWPHWAPPAWRGGIPFEIGLFYFLTLTGFLITRILLKRLKSHISVTKNLHTFELPRKMHIPAPSANTNAPCTPSSPLTYPNIGVS